MLSKVFLLNSKISAFLCGSGIGLGVCCTKNAFMNERPAPKHFLGSTAPSPPTLFDNFWSSKLVNCSRWDYSKAHPFGKFTLHDKFDLKHLLDGFDDNGNEATENDAHGWSRADINREMTRMMNFDPQNKIDYHHPYGKLHRFTFIMKRATDFNIPFGDPNLKNRIIDDLKCELKRNPAYPKSNNWTELQAPHIIWYPYKSIIIYGVWDKPSKSYDVYIVKNAFLLLGLYNKPRTADQKIPNHFEGFIVGKDSENDAFDLKTNNSPAQLQQRFQWSEMIDLWFVKDARCIRP